MSQSGAFACPISTSSPALAEPPRREHDFREEVLHGLSQEPKRLACKYFYDQSGSEIFDRITELVEYYQTRTEIGILRDNIGAIASLLGEHSQLVEYGSGSSLKTRILLENLPALRAYYPVDVSRDYLSAICSGLREEYPRLEVIPLVEDFTRLSAMPKHGTRRQNGLEKRTVFFPGSTIGNFHPAEARDLLERMRRMAGPGGALLIGVDLKKEPSIIEAAYNDSRGVTAEFNLNLLGRINRELSGRFRMDTFAHHAFYDDKTGRVEMHLVSLEDQEVRVGEEAFRFARGETIHTENSYKYSIPEFQELAGKAGFRPLHTWVDGGGLFSVHLFLNPEK